MSPRLLLQNQRGCSKSFDDGQSDIYPVTSDQSEGKITLDVFGARHVVPIVGAGKYAAYNTMAIAAVLYTLNQPIDVGLERLATFSRPVGRGRIITLQTTGGPAEIIDHSYNANPASMRAALEEFLAAPCKGRRVAILGDMAELGEETHTAHIAILEFLGKQSIDDIHLVGDAFKACSADVQGDARFRFTNLDEIDQIFDQQIDADDVILVKGSHSTGLFKYLDRFRAEVGSGKSW